MIKTKTFTLFMHGIFLCLVLCISSIVNSQSKLDSLLGKLDPQKFALSIKAKSEKLEKKLVDKSRKVLDKLQGEEKKVYEKLLHTADSATAKIKLAEIKTRYEGLKNKMNHPALLAKVKQYIPHLDSLNTSLQFLSDNGVGGKVKDALASVGSLQDKLQQAEAIKQFIKERRELLKQQLEKLGLIKQLKQINKQVYYYAAQLKEYKEIWKDPNKIEKKALELLSKTKIWKDFFRKNSMLAGLFRLPGDGSSPVDMATLAGLQTRVQVNNLIQQQIAAGGPNAQQQFQQNLQSAKSQLNALKDKVLKAGGGSSDAELSDFKPNNQKTKSFMQRLEYGANVQSQKASSFFPTTSDIGLSVGYKLNDKSIIGIGASYKLGWGRGWDHIALTHQGVGLRSYVDIKLKGSFWISGGFEQNYKTAFRDFIPLQDKSGWQQSGLVGISKVVSLKTKLFKKTSIRLLWDFLSYDQVPRTQPVVFRVGYNF